MAELSVRELREEKRRKIYGNALVFEIICNFEKPSLNRKRFARKATLPRLRTLVKIIVPCSQALYFLFKVRLARVTKNKTAGGFIDPPA